MPLSINVGLSRKASRNYQSAGVSINVTAELDQSLLAKPEELQKQISDLYLQADTAMKRQINTRDCSQRPDQSQPARANPRASNNGGPTNGNGNGRDDHSRSTSGATITASQRRAILAICNRMGIDLQLELREFAGAELDALSVTQASEFIDHLKSIQPAPTQR